MVIVKLIMKNNMKKIIFSALLVVFALNLSVLAQNETVSSADSQKIQLPYAKLDKDRVVGAVDVIRGDLLRHSTEYRANAALAGLAAGLYVDKSSGQPGSNSASLKIRGRSRGGQSDAPMIIVDGIPNRSLNDLALESIESISVLKDITAKMMYGSAAANGVILITTKRGYVSKRKIKLSVDGGLRTPTVLPEYIEAGDYAERYNQARINDGLDLPADDPAYVPFYSQEAIDHFKNGTSPLMYPNEDYYATFLRQYSEYERVNATLEGGNSGSQYYINLEYVHEEGLEAVGDRNKHNVINLMSNLDYRVNDVVSMSLDISSRMALRSLSNVSADNMFGALSSHRPGDYPFFVGQFGDIDSLGWSPVSGQTNLYGDLTRKGYNTHQTFRAQTSFGIDFDLNKYVDGLTAGVRLGFDSYNTISIGKTLSYSSFNVVREDSLVRVGVDNVKGSEKKNSDDFYRNIAGIANVDYVKDFGKSSLVANLVFTARSKALKLTQSGLATVQDDKNINTALRVNYQYDDKYVIEGTSSYMGTDRFQRGNRFGLFGAAGAGWIMSNEDFLSDADAIDYLKLKASYGVMGYDQAFDYFLYRDEFAGGGSMRFGIDNGALPVEYGQILSQLGNTALEFEKSRELNVGIEGRFFNNALSLEANYFNEYRYDIPTILSNSIPNYVSNVFPTGNYNAVSNQGVDLAVQFSKKSGDFAYSFGGNFMYSKSIWDQYDELNPYSNLDREGKATDMILGWDFAGFYETQADIDAHGVTSQYGEILPGDIKYNDYNNDLGDNTIDTYDRIEIGHSYPRINYALNLSLAFKGIELYVLGQGVTNVDKLLTNEYYYNTGEDKYSAYVLKDDYPRLTTYNSGHSYRASSYWMTDGSYFKIRTAELSYTLPESVSKKITASKVKFFVRGTDLLTFSTITELDPEEMDAGISSYPMMKTGSVGLKIVF